MNAHSKDIWLEFWHAPVEDGNGLKHFCVCAITDLYRTTQIVTNSEGGKCIDHPGRRTDESCELYILNSEFKCIDFYDNIKGDLTHPYKEIMMQRLGMEHMRRYNRMWIYENGKHIIILLDYFHFAFKDKDFTLSP